MSEQNVEAVKVVSQEMAASRDSILASLTGATEAVSEFFGGSNAIDATEGDSGIDTSTATTIILSAKSELVTANAIKITTADQYVSAAEDLKRIKGIAKEIEERRKAMTTKIDGAKNAVQALFKPATEFLTNAEAAIKRSMVAFDDEQARLQRIAEAQRQQAEAAERARVAAEQAAAIAKAEEKERELRQQAEAAAAAGDTVTAAKLEVKAEAQQEIGEAKADAIAVKAAETIVAPAPVAPVKVAGISKRVTYKVEVTDLKALCAAVAAGTVPLSAVKADEAALNRVANALKGDLNYPGCKVTSDTVIGSRSK